MNLDNVNKKCPFCNSGLTEVVVVESWTRRNAVECTDCGAVGPLADSPDEAVKKWQTRYIIIPRELIEGLEAL